MAFLVGVIFSGFDFAEAIQKERQSAKMLASHLVEINRARAAGALFTLNETLGAELVSNIQTFTGVGMSELRDVHGHTLARAEHERPSADHWQGQVGAWLLGYDRLTRHALTTDDMTYLRGRSSSVTPREPLGYLLIAFDAGHFGSQLYANVLSLLFMGSVRAILIGIALVVVFQNFVTRPIVRLGRDILRVRFDSEQPDQLPQPKEHLNDELGYLVRRMNLLLNRLSASQRELRRVAITDPLTQLPNRAAMLERIREGLQKVARPGVHLAVIVIDVDRFKQINDSLGYEVGDGLLVSVAARLRAALRAEDALGRLGGDEFLVVARETSAGADFEALLARLRDQFRPAFEIAGHQLHVGASFGVSLAPDQSADANALLRQADTALHVAKQSGGNNWSYFSHDMAEQLALRLQTEIAIRQALEQGDFEVVLQPKVEARSGRVCGAEALIRWQRDGVTISPAHFIPLAEQTGLIVPIGDYVFEEVCRIVSLWRTRMSGFHIAINVSARQLDDPGFLDRVLDVMSRYQIRPGEIEVEITESEVMRRGDHYAGILATLRKVGVRVAIDDFGTGYSNLAYLKVLPIDVLKIDGSFVRTIPNDVVIASMVIGLAEQLALETCAEGVETGDHATWLKGSGCTYLQGYLFSRPVSVQAFADNYLSA